MLENPHRSPSSPALEQLYVDLAQAGYEDPGVVSDAIRWLADQDSASTGRILALGELRQSGVVHPQTTVHG